MNLHELLERRREIAKDYDQLMRRFEQDGHLGEIERHIKRGHGGRGETPTNICFTVRGFLLAMQYFDDKRSAKFRMMQATMTERAARHAVEQRLREAQTRIEELTQAQSSLTHTVAAQEQDIDILENGVYNYIRTRLDLRPLYTPTKNLDARIVNHVLRALWKADVLVKRGPNQVTYFKSRSAMKRGQKIVERFVEEWSLCGCVFQYPYKT